MVHHIVAWTFHDEYSQEEKAAHAKRIKQELEALTDVIDGIVALAVVASPLPASSCDAALVSIFESEDALAAYQAHPEHQKVRTFIHSVLKHRSCLDYAE